MALFNFRLPGTKSREEAAAPAASDSVEVMRRRARHRLIGATVLVGLGIVVFPLLFDTQPRPIAVDTPITIPDRNKAAPLSAPGKAAPLSAPGKAARAPAASDSNPVASSGIRVAEVAGLDEGEEVIAPRTAKTDAKAETKPEPKANQKTDAKPTPEPAVTAKAEAKPEPKAKAAESEAKAKPKAETKAEAKTEPKAPAEAKAKPAPRQEEEARIRALLEGKGNESEEASARLVVQVGAFAEGDKAREIRSKLEQAGLKTYTQVAETKDGKRTRVRVGPFANRAEAERAAQKIKKLDLPASILSL